MAKFKIYISLFLVFIFTASFFTQCFAEETTYVWSSNVNVINYNNTVTENTITDTSSEVSNNSLNLESGAAILIEQSTGQILYAHNIHEQLRPASVTKIMSILLIMESLDNEKISLTDNVPCSENAASMGGSQIWLDPRETLTVDEMLKAICVASANEYDVQN